MLLPTLLEMCPCLNLDTCDTGAEVPCGGTPLLLSGMGCHGAGPAPWGSLGQSRMQRTPPVRSLPGAAGHRAEAPACRDSHMGRGWGNITGNELLGLNTSGGARALWASPRGAPGWPTTFPTAWGEGAAGEGTQSHLSKHCQALNSTCPHHLPGLDLCLEGSPLARL